MLTCARKHGVTSWKIFILKYLLICTLRRFRVCVCVCVYVNAVPVQGWTGPNGSMRLTLPGFLDMCGFCTVWMCEAYVIMWVWIWWVLL